MQPNRCLSMRPIHNTFPLAKGPKTKAVLRQNRYTHKANIIIVPLRFYYSSTISIEVQYETTYYKSGFMNPGIQEFTKLYTNIYTKAKTMFSFYLKPTRRLNTILYSPVSTTKTKPGRTRVRLIWARFFVV